MVWPLGLLMLALLLTPAPPAPVHADSPRLVSTPLPGPLAPLPSQLSVRAAEGPAWSRLAEAEQALLLVYHDGGQRFGWTPSFPVPVYLVASGDALVDSLERHSGMPALEAERYRPLNGAFRFVWQGDRVEAGIHLNVTRLVAPGAVTRAIADEYVHLMQWDLIRREGGGRASPSGSSRVWPTTMPP